MFLQYKGKGWVLEEDIKAGEKGIQHFGDKRQMTMMPSTSAAGDILPVQLCLEGTTERCFPKTSGIKYKASATKGDFEHEAWHLKSQESKSIVGTRGFVPTGLAFFIAGIGSLCATHNHWANFHTSMAYVKDIYVPYVKAKINELRRAATTNVCKPFGEQVARLLAPPLEPPPSPLPLPRSRCASSLWMCGLGGSTNAFASGSTKTTRGFV